MTPTQLDKLNQAKTLLEEVHAEVREIAQKELREKGADHPLKGGNKTLTYTAKLTGALVDTNRALELAEELAP